MSQQEQKQDTEQQERRYFEIASRLHFCVLDGYLTKDEFEDILIAMGILTDWKRSQK